MAALAADVDVGEAVAAAEVLLADAWADGATVEVELATVSVSAVEDDVDVESVSTSVVVEPVVPVDAALAADRVEPAPPVDSTLELVVLDAFLGPEVPWLGDVVLPVAAALGRVAL